MSRTKVVARRNGWPRLLVLAVASLAIVLLMFITGRWTSYTFIPTPSAPGVVTGTRSIHVGTVVVLFLLLPAWLAILSWSEQRWGYAILETLAVWAGMVIATLSWYLAHPGWELMNNLSPALALGVIYLPSRLVALTFVRFLVVSLVYQDGSLCSSCGYNLTGNLSGICPECGVPWQPIDTTTDGSFR